MAKAYWIGIVDVKNQEEYKKYADIAGPALIKAGAKILSRGGSCLLYTSPSPRDLSTARMPSSA